MNSSKGEQSLSLNIKNSSRSTTNEEIVGQPSVNISGSPNTDKQKLGPSPFNYSISNSNSTNPNISKNEDLIKIKKFKIVNLPSDIKTSTQVGIQNNIFNNNLKKSFNSKLDMQSVDSNKYKLTFEKAFSFRKSNANTASIVPNSSNTNLNTLLTQPQIHGGISNNSNPIVINNFPPQSQISISINNFNISNYNMNTKKFKKSPNQISSSLNITPYSQVDVTKSLESQKFSTNLIPSLSQATNTSNSNTVTTPNRAGTKNKSYVYINDESSPTKSHQVVEKNEKNESNLLAAKNSQNVFNSGTKLKIVKSEFYPNKEAKTKCPSKKSNKIETIIDGNNDDSFINELADLLNNVDNKRDPVLDALSEVKEEFISDVERKVVQVGEEVPDPRINFAQLQQVNSKRPQTSYGGLSARQKSLQKSLRQKSSRVSGTEKFEEMFPMPQNSDIFQPNSDYKNVQSRVKNYY